MKIFYKDDINFGKTISRKEFWAYTIVGLCSLISPIVVGCLLVAYFLKW